MIRDNLIYNPSFAEGTTGWSAFASGSIAVHTDDSFIGHRCVKFTKSSTTVDAGVFSAAGFKAPVTVGDIYSASAYVKVPVGQETIEVRANIRWYDSAGTFLGGSPGTLTTVTDADGWVRLTTENETAITSAAFADVVIYQDSGTKTIGNYFLVDAVKLENSAVTTQFIEPRNQDQENKRVNIALSPVPIPHLTGMQLKADIMLNDIVFNTIDENDVVWVCSDIQGWWNLPDSEVPDLTRGLDDGSYDVRGRYSARNLTFTGSLLCPDADSAAVARNKLIEAIDLIHKGGWLLVNESPTKAAFVRISGRPEIENVNARGRINFSIGLRAANPIKYEWNWEDADGYVTSTVTNGSSGTLANDGNTNVPIVFTIAGGATANLTAPITINNTTLDQTLTVVKTLRAENYSVNITKAQRSDYTVTLTTAGHSFYVGDVITISGVTTSGSPRTTLNNDIGVTISNVTATTITYTGLTSGTLADIATDGAIGLDNADTLEVDTYNKTALFNGEAFYNGGSISARSFIDPLVDWIVLQPGDNTITFTDSGGTTDLTIKYRSGWIG
jgi:hypothetical protein